MRGLFRLVFGLVLVMTGLVLMAYSLQPKPVPPVIVLQNQSGYANEGRAYFDQVAIRNYGASNVTVGVAIEDSKPRLSDPVTLYEWCNITVQIEAVQQFPNWSFDQYSFCTNQLSNPQPINVECPSEGAYEAGAGTWVTRSMPAKTWLWAQEPSLHQAGSQLLNSHRLNRELHYYNCFQP